MSSLKSDHKTGDKLCKCVSRALVSETHISKTVQISLQHAMQAASSRSVVLPIFNDGARKGWMVSVKSHLLDPHEKDPVPNVQEATWASGPVRVGPTELASTVVQIMDCPAGGKLLYQLHYPRCPYII
jgi:hypothetical protein